MEEAADKLYQNDNKYEKINFCGMDVDLVSSGKQRSTGGH
jgi:hypothetical protein